MRLNWDQIGERLYETGVDHVALYFYNPAENKYTNGIAWNGVTAINQSPSGAEFNPIWADNIKYLNLMSAEEFGASIEAYMYPDEFKQCDGSAALMDGINIGQQSRAMFGLSYRTKIGNDVDGDEHGYKLHLIYGCMASPSERGYQTVSDSPEAISMSWEITTTPVPVTGHKPTSYVEIDSTKVDDAVLAALEDQLYGNDTQVATLPLPDAILAIAP